MTVNLHLHCVQRTIPMGRTVLVEAAVEAASSSPQDYILLPFVNQRRWGAHERADARSRRPPMGGKATFMLPLPNPGPAHVQVLVLRSDTDQWMGLHDQALLMAGHPLPDRSVAGEAARSDVLALEVTRRPIPPHVPSGTLFGMQWEPWFTRGPQGWSTAQAVPIMGFYDSYHRDVIRQHMLWFMDLGIDFVLADWTNHIWGCQHWDERPDHVNAIVHATTLALETLADMRAEGLPVPKVVLFSGLSNGRPATMGALNEELAWIYHNYVRNPRFEGLWQDFDSPYERPGGKPLIVVLDTGAVGDKRGTTESAFRIPFFKQTLELSAAELDALRAAQPPVDDRHFTVRWMSSQNQTTRHHELGYWSWMDGVIDPPVMYRQGIAEAVTVTPAFFNARGWTDPLAYGRRNGATYIETFKVALQHRPRVIFLHQFQEYTGQPEGHGYGPDRDIYVDTYSVELSDDLEPVSLTAPGYRGDKGGWGFYYLNLTQALMALYRGQADDCTILAVSSPLGGAVASGPVLRVAWTSVGAPAESFTIAIDGKIWKEKVTGDAAGIPLAGLSPGPHRLTVIANGATTRYPLSLTELDVPLERPIPVEAHVPFTVG